MSYRCFRCFGIASAVFVQRLDTRASLRNYKLGPQHKRFHHDDLIHYNYGAYGMNLFPKNHVTPNIAELPPSVKFIKVPNSKKVQLKELPRKAKSSDKVLVQ